MHNAVWFISYKLVEGASISEFLQASEKCHDEVLSKKKGFISWKVLVDGDTWVDLVTWETMEDAIDGESDDGEQNPVASKFYSFIDPYSCKSQLYCVKENY